MDNNITKHSIKVPQNYKAVARVLKKVIEDGMGLKSVIYGNDDIYNRNKQRNFALADSILRNYPKIEHILTETNILNLEPRLDPWLARVLIYELIFRKDLNHCSKPIQTIISYKSKIQEAVSTYEEIPDSLQQNKVTKPRYVRVNTFKMPVSEVVNKFRDDGMTFIPSQQETYEQYLECISQLPEYHFMIDFHIKEILVCGPGFEFINHDLYKNGTLILQDKSSCMAPFLLAPPEKSSVLDMCAAPGMKANYLANLVGKNGHVYAVERDQGRYLTLSKLVNAQNMKNIHCMHRDSTKITGDELADVEYILVDPSCSGSGIVNRVDFEKSRPDRIKKLTGFQVTILRHALTNFPNVKRVTYSTCSLNAEENEEVIRDTLKYISEYQLVNLKEKLGSNWLHYGAETYGSIGSHCLYTNPEKDLTNGFFVAVFERKPFDPQRRRNKQHRNGIFEKSQTKYEDDQNENIEENVETEIQSTIPEESTEKKKKRKKKNEIQNAIPEVKEKKKRKKNKDNNIENEDNLQITEESSKKKKKDQIKSENLIEENSNEQNTVPETKEKKKKRKKNKHNIVENEENLEITEESVKKKKKDKIKNKENPEEFNEIQTVPEETKEKKKKRKKHEKENDNEEEITDVPIKKKKKNKHRIEDNCEVRV